MIIIYTIKLTDKIIYIFHIKKKQLTEIEIKKNIIKENKVYDPKKLINLLNKILKENLINNKLFKTKIYLLLNKNLNPSENFCFKYVFNNILNINYKIIYEENLLKEKNELILWEDYLYFKSKLININDKNAIKKDLENKNYILIGNSSNWEKYKQSLEDNLKNEILEYENSHTILFERV